MDLTSLSNIAFAVALVLYLAAMVGYFHFLAYRRPTVVRVARVLALAGLGAQAASVAARGIEAGRVPWGNMYEYASMMGLLIVAAYLLVVERVWHTERVGGFAIGTAVLAMAAATLVYVPPGPLVPALNAYWLKIHVVAAMLSSALFALGFMFSVLYLVRERGERREARASAPARAAALVAVGGGERPEDYAPAEPEGEAADAAPRSRLPSAAALDRMAYRIIAFAFPIWTFAIIAGAIWAEEAWGRYWGWDPKEVWSFITWVLFAAYLHARATVGWRGRRAAALAVVGFVSLVFNLIVVNTAIVGLHSYAGT